jgi:hypothetical protein
VHFERRSGLGSSADEADQDGYEVVDLVEDGFVFGE